jgi:HTH-type transcriptional regulator/antitoxin HigA
MKRSSRKMDIRPINRESDYDWALKEIEPYFEKVPRRGSPEADRFDVLSTLIEAYEEKNWPIAPPDPLDAIRFRMEQAGYQQSDLAELVGSRSRASEILRGKRALTMEQAWRLHREWHIPAEALLKPPRAKRA